MCKHTYIHKTKKKIHYNKKKRFRYKLKKKSKKKSSTKIISTNDTHNHKNVFDNSELLKNMELIHINLIKYSNGSLENHLKSYRRDNLCEALDKELNRKIITEEILNKYNLTNSHRKYAFKYLYNLTIENEMDIKCFFSALYIFDLFLVNYSENNLNKNNCQNFFKSKVTNEISKIKLIIFILCCLYNSLKYFTTNTIELNQFLQDENAKKEYTYENLINLSYDIIEYTYADICDINIYHFSELYLSKLWEKLGDSTNNEKFIKYFKGLVNYFSFRTIYNISLLEIFDSIKALGIIIFCYEKSKSLYKENNQKLDTSFLQWRENLRSLLINYDEKGLEKINNFLNTIN